MSLSIESWQGRAGWLWPSLPWPRHCKCVSGWAPELPGDPGAPSPHSNGVLWEKFREHLPTPYLPVLRPSGNPSVTLPNVWVLVTITTEFHASISSLQFNPQTVECTRGNIWIQRNELIPIPLDTYLKHLSLLDRASLLHSLSPWYSYFLGDFSALWQALSPSMKNAQSFLNTGE